MGLGEATCPGAGGGSPEINHPRAGCLLSAVTIPVIKYYKRRKTCQLPVSWAGGMVIIYYQNPRWFSFWAPLKIMIPCVTF